MPGGHHLPARLELLAIGVMLWAIFELCKSVAVAVRAAWGYLA